MQDYESKSHVTLQISLLQNQQTALLPKNRQMLQEKLMTCKNQLVIPAPR